MQFEKTTHNCAQKKGQHVYVCTALVNCALIHMRVTRTAMSAQHTHRQRACKSLTSKSYLQSSIQSALAAFDKMLKMSTFGRKTCINNTENLIAFYLVCSVFKLMFIQTLKFCLMFHFFLNPEFDVNGKVIL